ncbi:MAG: hypothetical protein WAV90_00590 [Gordonia amarae]
MTGQDWLTAEAVQAPTVVASWCAAPIITLSKLADGSARLMWVFDENAHGELSQRGLFIHLTDAEAQAVFDSPTRSGLIESVRAQLIDTAALLWEMGQHTLRATFIAIPRTGTETELWEYIDAQSALAEHCEMTMRGDIAPLDEPGADAAELARAVRQQTLRAAAESISDEHDPR